MRGLAWLRRPLFVFLPVSHSLDIINKHRQRSLLSNIVFRNSVLFILLRYSSLAFGFYPLEVFVEK